MYLNGAYLFGVVILSALLLPLHFVNLLDDLLISIFVSLFLILYQFLFSWLVIVISVKRLHDVNKSRYWIFVTLVPVFGILLIIYWITRPSVDNRTD